MEPLFTIKTHITEKQYRRGLKDGLNKLRNILEIVIPIVFIIYIIVVMIYFEFVGESMNYIMYFAAIAGCLFFLWTHFYVNKKNIQRAIDLLAVKAGSTEVNYFLSFYEEEVIIQIENCSDKGHVAYSDVIIIKDFGDFILLQSSRSVAIYISKMDVPDNHAFSDFIWSKCPNAKFKQY